MNWELGQGEGEWNERELKERGRERKRVERERERERELREREREREKVEEVECFRLLFFLVSFFDIKESHFFFFPHGLSFGPAFRKSSRCVQSFSSTTPLCDVSLSSVSGTDGEQKRQWHVPRTPATVARSLFSSPPRRLSVFFVWLKPMRPRCVLSCPFLSALSVQARVA